MALTANTIPSQIPQLIAPFDIATALATQPTQTLAATGYMGAPTQLDVGPGRIEAYWAIDVTSVDMSSVDEIYKFHLMGSNDVAWGNGNVELLAYHDFAAATAGRVVATILGASPAIPEVAGLGGSMLVIPFTNLMQRIVYRYIRGYVVIAGTSPTITFNSWLSYDANAS